MKIQALSVKISILFITTTPTIWWVREGREQKVEGGWVLIFTTPFIMLMPAAQCCNLCKNDYSSIKDFNILKIKIGFQL